MYAIGDTVFYGSNGVCVVEEIQELAFTGEAKSYYILRSHQNETIKLFCPVDAEDAKLTPVISKEKGEVLLELFNQPPGEWIHRSIDRSKSYHEIITSNRVERIAQMLNTILHKKYELEEEGKKLFAMDVSLLKQVLPIFLDELSISLSVSKEDIMDTLEKQVKLAREKFLSDVNS